MKAGNKFLLCSLYVVLICALLPRTAHAGCDNPGPCFIYLPGGGRTSDEMIDQAVQHIKTIIGDSTNQNFISYSGSGRIVDTPVLSLREYTDGDINRIAADIVHAKQQGKDIYVVGASAGSAAFQRVSHVLGPNNRVKLLVEVEPAYPAGNPPSWSVAEYSIYIRNVYEGPAGSVFENVLGLRPPSGSFDLFQIEVGHYTNGSAHSPLVGEWELMGATLVKILVAQGDAAFQQALQTLANRYTTLRSSPHSRPGVSTGGGFGPGAGGATGTVGSESYPLWLKDEEYRRATSQQAKESL